MKSLKIIICTFCLSMLIPLSQSAQAQAAMDNLLVSESSPSQTTMMIAKGSKLKEALGRIESKFGVVFLYQSGELDHKRVKKDFYVPNSLKQALSSILHPFSLTYQKVNSQSYVIYREANVPETAARQFHIEGTVTDSTTGDPLPGVNIIVKGTSNGAATDPKGHYTLDVSSSTDTLQFSYIGYTTKTIPVNGQSQINVQLSPTTISGHQLVVVGYGTQQKRDVTGAISSVQGSDMDKLPTTSFDQALQGKASGVQITPASGAPGAQATVRIRGVGTLNDASPLYVVDGMITNDISFLSPDNIQSVNVLKDASAEAIYGSRGANGVIIITTKQAQKNQKTQVSLNAYYGWQEIQHKISLTNASQYATLVNELNKNEGRPAAFSNPSSLGAGTDWQSLVYQTAPMEHYDLNVSGGTNNMTYNVSGNFVNQKGIIPKSGYKRVSLRINNEYDISKNIKFGHNIVFTHSYNKHAPNVVGQTYYVDPTVSPYTSSGAFSNTTTLAPIGNPLATIYYTHNKYFNDRLVGNVYATVDFLKHFEFKSNFGLDMIRMDDKVFNPEFFVSSIQQNKISNLTVENDKQRSWLWDNTLTYKQTIGNSQIKAMADFTSQSFFSENLSGTRSNIVGNGSSRALWYLQAGNSQSASNADYVPNDWSMLSYLGRINYSYLDRYLLTANFRVDGSSRFGSNNRYGFFPSIALGWRMSDEPFMRNISFISHFKLRGSWGKIGNDKISSFPGIPTVQGNLNAVFGPQESINYGATVVDLANPNVKWEETTQKDIGLETGFFNDQLQVNVDYYNKLTNGILVQVPIPLYVGAQSNPYVNAAKVLNRGFDFNVKWRQLTGDFNYSIGVEASTVHNEVKSLGQGKQNIYAGSPGVGGFLTTRTAPGLPIGSFYGYKVVGVFQNQSQLSQDATTTNYTEVPGDLMFKDINGDGKIDPAHDRTYLGSSIPSLTFGINLSAGYKDFDLSASFTGQTGNKIYNAKKMARFGTPNFETSYLNRWHGPGTSNSEPRVTNGGVNYVVSSRFLEDGSYLELKNLQLGYTLPGDFASQLHVQKLRFYLNGSNLVTFTKYSGYTPQITNYNPGDPSSENLSNGIDHGIYPVARSFSIGLDMTF